MNENGRDCALHNHMEDKKNCDKEWILYIKILLAIKRHHSPMTDYLFSRKAERIVELEGLLVYLAGFPIPHKSDVCNL